jgi:DNA-binding MarR family transcriptional regulator
LTKTTPEEQHPEAQLGPVLVFMRVLWGLDHALQITSKRMESRLGITGPQRLVLRLVGQFPGVSAGVLAELQKVHPSTLTGVLRRLEERGFLRRKKDPRDARRALLWLTTKGMRLNEIRTGTVEAAVGQALSQVSPEALAGAHQTIAVLRESLEQQGRAAAEQRPERPRKPRSR